MRPVWQKYANVKVITYTHRPHTFHIININKHTIIFCDVYYEQEYKFALIIDQKYHILLSLLIV